MFRLAYRNFGNHESLVVNHTVAGGPLAGVRWYEIRSPDLDPSVARRSPSLRQASFHRWGDYSSMAIDPKDDCIFWYTQEYYKTTGSFNWSTRITAFKFNSCK